MSISSAGLVHALTGPGAVWLLLVERRVRSALMCHQVHLVKGGRSGGGLRERSRVGNCLIMLSSNMLFGGRAIYIISFKMPI